MKKNILKTTVRFAATVFAMMLIFLVFSTSVSSETLYNGIEIDQNSFKSIGVTNDSAQLPSYLSDDHPAVVNVDVGRQLFVDDFLIDSTTLETVYYKAVKNPTPVLVPVAAGEKKGASKAAPVGGGVWYDETSKVYKMWYEAGLKGDIAYAESKYGINWVRIPCNELFTNVCLDTVAVGSSVWINPAPKSDDEKYIMLVSESGSQNLKMYKSNDGKNWVFVYATPNTGDRTTIFYNPFRNKWVFSLRSYRELTTNGMTVVGARTRSYLEMKDILNSEEWIDSQIRLWQRTDTADMVNAENGIIPEVYSFDCIAYESIMLGLFEIWYGPDNDTCALTNNPKITELQASYSRDGFHYYRPERTALINASRTEGSWDYGYVQSVCGGVIIYDDEIRIYYTGFSGTSYGDGTDGWMAGGATGYATLRRDGFASLSGSGEMNSVPITFTKGQKYMFVNADCANGSLKAELTDEYGNVIDGFSFNDCETVVTDSCKQMISWGEGKDLSKLNGNTFRVRFKLENSDLYSFWFSDDTNGESNGMHAAGYVSPDQPEDIVTTATDTTDEPSDPDTETTTQDTPTPVTTERAPVTTSSEENEKGSRFCGSISSGISGVTFMCCAGFMTIFGVIIKRKQR